MARTSTTRPKGNGAGYGGPARGAGNHKAGPGRPTREAAEVIRLEKQARIDALKEHLIGLALHAEREETQVTATLGFLKHEDPPAARLDVTSKGERVEAFNVVSGVERDGD